jgi:hypothetical protein
MLNFIKLNLNTAAQIFFCKSFSVGLRGAG